MQLNFVTKIRLQSILNYLELDAQAIFSLEVIV